MNPTHFPSILVTGKRKEADKSPMQFYRKAVLFLTIDLAEDLLDLLLAPIAVDVHLEDAGLPIWR
jgi:NADH:ubiquinone oxidoreductase subunit 3 (subunit A)